MKLSQAIEVFTHYKEQVGDVELVEFLNGTVLGSKLRFALAQKAYNKGATHDLTYNSWIAMIKRCFDTSHPEYARYGGANILPCASWLKYENFLNDVGQRPNKDATLDRIDGTKGYYKENCHWASKAQQANNTRRNVRVTLPEFSGTLVQACVFFNMPYDCVRKRLKRGASVEDALKTPLQPGSAMRQRVQAQDSNMSEE